MKNGLRILLILLLFGVFVLLRWKEGSLFFDPLYIYFKSSVNIHNGMPEINMPKLLASMALRYFINAIISLVIIFIAFGERATVQFAALIYTGAFILLMLGFWYLLHNYTTENYMLLFYVRRFLIQPLFVLILLPAFYYQKKIENSN